MNKGNINPATLEGILLLLVFTDLYVCFTDHTDKCRWQRTLWA